MVHWSLLLVAFVLGFGACYLILWTLSRVGGHVIKAIRQGIRDARFE